MPRTTAEKVAEIIEVDEDISLTPFILSANELVTECCLAADYTSTRLELIERYLAAHFYTLRDPRPVREEAGSVAITYQSKVGLRLSVSHYGQHAIVLDTAGGLKALDEGIRTVKLKVCWLGTEDMNEDYFGKQLRKLTQTVEGLTELLSTAPKIVHILTVDEDPNGVYTAPQGSLAIDDAGAIWIKNDGDDANGWARRL